MIDRTALKFNQACIVAFISVAWLTGWDALVGIAAAIMLVGTAWPPASLFGQLYARIFQPAGLLRPQMLPDRNAPHRFAQGLGGVCVAAAYFLLIIGFSTAGWSLSLLVLVLALVNIVFNFCAGCFLFYQLERLGLLGSPKGA